MIKTKTQKLLLMKKLTLLFLVITLFYFLEVKGQDSFLQSATPAFFVIQPNLQINTTNLFNLWIRDNVTVDSLFVGRGGGIQLNGNLEKKMKDFAGKNWILYKSTFVSEQLGEVAFPQIKIYTPDAVLPVSTFKIKVLETLPEITPKEFKLIWESDKSTYSQKDTITLNLYDYTQYMFVERSVVNKNLSIEGEGTQNVSDTLLGQDFKEDIQKRFNVVSLKNEALYPPKMDSLDNDLWIKSHVLQIKLTPKARGLFKLKTMDLAYRVYKSETDYFDAFQPTPDGNETYLVQPKPVIVATEPLKIRIK